MGVRSEKMGEDGFVYLEYTPIHLTRSVPIYSIADSIFIITVSLQKDICPHGNKYPINAVVIIVNL